MNKDELTIEDWGKGTAPSPLYGFGLLRNVDIYTNPGSVCLNNLLAKVSNSVIFTVTVASPAIFTKTGHGLVATNPVRFTTTGALPTGLTAGTIYYVIAAGLTADAFEVSATVGGSAINTSGSQSGVHTYTTVTGLIIGFRRNPLIPTDIWAYDSGATVYKSADTGATWSIVTGNSTGTGMGIEIWKDYLFVSTATKLDVYGPLSSSPAWSANWKTLTSDTFHTMLRSIDDKLYICNNRYVASLTELTTFAPATGASFTWNATAITLATNYQTKCLADLGQFLMIGTWMGLNAGALKVADIFPYSRSSLTLGVPLRMQENAVNSMISWNNRLYIQAGLSGRIFESDSVSFVEIAKIPNYVANLDGGYIIYSYPEAIMVHQSRLFVGFSTGGGVANMGVWSLKPQQGQNILVLENTISTGNDGTFDLRVGALISTYRDVYIASWLDSNAYGIDKMDNALRVTSYGGVVESPLYQVGGALWNRTMAQLESYFEKPLVSGQGIKIKYRFNLTDAFTTLGTYDFSSLVATELTAFNKPASVITNAVFIQIRIELTTGASNLTPELKRILFKESV